MNAEIRHATYYLNLYLSLADRSTLYEADWQKFEFDLHNLLYAWEWLKDNKDNSLVTELFTEYAELGWILLELSHRNLTQIVWRGIERNNSEAKNAEESEVKGKEENTEKEIIQRLNRFLSSQEQILSAFSKNEVSGSSNVSISGVVNSHIHINNFIFDSSDMPDFNREIETAYHNKDYKSAGNLLFEKGKILQKLGYLSDAITIAAEALENFNKIEHTRAADVQKQLSKWKDTVQ
ncbi:MAG: hypothetical protein LUM44_06280 [Pyrinomonadaceae bacterium]|nr:hypothetical protein [Pyrinomonadaceae bacterium]